MIKLYLNGKTFPIQENDDLYIQHSDQSLHFSVSSLDPNSLLIKEEVNVEFLDQIYLIKYHEDDGERVVVDCQVNLDDLKSKKYMTYTAERKRLHDIMNEILVGTGWTAKNDITTTVQKSFELESCWPLEIIEECCEQYGVTARFDAKKKEIHFIQIALIQDKGFYIYDSLNLDKLNYSSDSYKLFTKLRAYGKQNEETEEYVTFSSLNGGKDYIEDYSYIDKVIEEIWIDERYEDPQALLDAAREKLNQAAKPKETFDIEIINLKKLNPQDYYLFDFALYDLATLIDRKAKRKITHRIVEYLEYIYHPEMDRITLSSNPDTIEGQIITVNSSVESLSTENKHNRKIVNEAIRDIEKNYAKIEEVYTKGQTDVQIKTEIEQSMDSIILEASKTFTSKNETSEIVKDISARFDLQADRIDLSVRQAGLNNLLINSDFINRGSSENELSGWTFATLHNAENVTWNVVSDAGNKIGRAVMIECRDENEQPRIWQSVSIKRKTKNFWYRMEFKAIGINLVNLWCIVYYTDGTNKQYIKGFNPNQNEWTPYGMLIEVDKTKVIDRIWCTLYNTKTGGQVYFACPMLVEADTTLDPELWTNNCGSDVVAQINASTYGVKIKGERIDLTGLVTITDLQGSGKTVINADNLTTGTIRGLTIEAARHLHFGGDDAYINFDWYTGAYTGVLISGNKDITFESNSLGFSAKTALFVDGYRALDEDITVKNWDGNLLSMRFKKGIAWYFTGAAWSSGGGFTGNYNGMVIKNGIIQSVNGSEGSH